MKQEKHDCSTAAPLDDKMADAEGQVRELPDSFPSRFATRVEHVGLGKVLQIITTAA